MNKPLSIPLALACCCLLTALPPLEPATAASISVDDPPQLNLLYDQDGGYEEGSDTVEGGFHVEHTYNDAIVEAAANAVQGDGDTDLDITVKVNGQDEQMLVDGGTAMQNLTVWTGSDGDGVYTEDITWTAGGGTLSGTPQGTYLWDVTFTLSEK